MNWVCYIEETRQNALQHLEENIEYFDDFEDAWDSMQDADDVTGNMCGSFHCNSFRAKQDVADIIWDDEVIEEFKALGYSGIPMEKGPEAVDVIARFIALGYSYSELKEKFDELKEESEDE